MIDRALVLAAGKSTRIASVSHGRPKPLLVVGERSILEHNLAWLAAAGIRRVWINLHYRPELIQEVIGDGRGFGLEVNYSPEPTILGTAGAWKNLERCWTGTSLVVYGDNLLRFDLDAFYDQHRASGAAATVALFDPSRHLNTGIAGSHVELDGLNRVVRFVERPPEAGASGQYVNAGAYFLEPAVATWIGAGFQDFGRDVLPRLASEGCLQGYPLSDDGYCLGLDTPESFAVASALLHSGRIALT